MEQGKSKHCGGGAHLPDGSSPIWLAERRWSKLLFVRSFRRTKFPDQKKVQTPARRVADAGAFASLFVPRRSTKRPPDNPLRPRDSYILRSSRLFTYSLDSTAHHHDRTIGPKRVAGRPRKSPQLPEFFRRRSDNFRPRRPAATIRVFSRCACLNCDAMRLDYRLWDTAGRTGRVDTSCLG